MTVIYRSSDSKLIGTYEYDLWGRPVSVTEATAGIDTDGILSKNPLRYRGCYYDSETGFYYLQSRYYDAGVRRFISADDVAVLSAEHENIGQYNLYAYCWNNVINMEDDMGYLPKWIKKAAIMAARTAEVAFNHYVYSDIAKAFGGHQTIKATLKETGGKGLAIIYYSEKRSTA